MLMFLAALGLLTAVVVVFGIYNRTDNDMPSEPKPKGELTWQWIVAIVITIVVPLVMLLGIWLLPEW
jgi:hypothetical protein